MDKMDAWFENAWNFQQNMRKMRGNCRMNKYDSLNESHKASLMSIKHLELFKTQLDFIFDILYGQEESREDRNKKIIKEVTDKVEKSALKYIKEYCNFSCTFFNLKMKDNVSSESLYCVLWFQKDDGKTNLLLDMSDRHYKSWEDFMEHNMLPKCYMIYPEKFTYFSPKSIFIELIFEESISCSAKRKFKSGLDMIASVGSLAATGILVFNPATAPVIIGAGVLGVVSGTYSIGNNIRNLVDLAKRDEKGLSLNKKTLCNVGEIVTNVGITACGASGLVKGASLVKEGIILKESSFFFKVANNVQKIGSITSGLNATVQLASIIIKFKKTGIIDMEDYKQFVKYISFAFVAYVSEQTFRVMIEKLNLLSIDIIQSLVMNPRQIYDCYFTAKTFINSERVDQLILFLFPNIRDNYLVVCKILNITTSMINRAINITEKINKRENCVELITYLFKEMPAFVTGFDQIVNETKKILQKINNVEKVGDGMSSLIEKYNLKNGIELKVNGPSFNKDLFLAESTITDLVNTFFADDCFYKELAKNKLWSNILSIIQPDVSEIHLAVSPCNVSEKINIYLYYFTVLYLECLENYYFDYFKYSVQSKRNSLKVMLVNEYFKEKFNLTVGGIHKIVFTSVFKEITSEFIDEKLEDHLKNNPERKNTKNNKVFQLNLSSFKKFTEKDCYDIVKEKIPELAIELTCENTLFSTYTNENAITMIINFVRIPVVLFFFMSNSKGILLSLVNSDNSN